jgi:hypothetical protein
MSDLVAYVQQEGRVCPKQEKWRQLWEMLPGRFMAGAGCYPDPALIYQHWLNTSDAEKQQRLAFHIEFAEQHGALKQVAQFLRGLSEKDWLHEGELALLATKAAEKSLGSSRQSL